MKKDCITCDFAQPSLTRKRAIEQEYNPFSLRLYLYIYL